MKKSLFIMIIGMIFSIGVWIGGTVWIDQGKEQVEVIESVLYGEVEKAIRLGRWISLRQHFRFKIGIRKWEGFGRQRRLCLRWICRLGL